MPQAIRREEEPSGTSRVNHRDPLSSLWSISVRITSQTAKAWESRLVSDIAWSAVEGIQRLTLLTHYLPVIKSYLSRFRGHHWLSLTSLRDQCQAGLAYSAPKSILNKIEGATNRLFRIPRRTFSSLFLSRARPELGRTQNIGSSKTLPKISIIMCSD